MYDPQHRLQNPIVARAGPVARHAVSGARLRSAANMTLFLARPKVPDFGAMMASIAAERLRAGGFRKQNACKRYTACRRSDVRDAVVCSEHAVEWRDADRRAPEVAHLPGVDFVGVGQGIGGVVDDVAVPHDHVAVLHLERTGDRTGCHG